MSAVVLTPLAAPSASLSADHPSGPSLEYDALFIAMERAASGREEQQFGQTVIDAEPPQWSAVRKLATELLQRTHDLRVGIYLAESVIESEGLTGFTNCVELLVGWLRDEWDSVHPQLEAEDDFDPTLRVNTLIRLTDSHRVLQRLRAVPLTDLRGLGSVTIGDLIALTEINAANHDATTTIEATLSGGPTEPLVIAATSLHNALMAINDLDQALCERIGVAKSVEFGPLMRILKTPLSVLADRLERRGVRLHLDAEPRQEFTALNGSSAAPCTAPSASEPTTVINSSFADSSAHGVPAPAAVSPRDWQIASRDDVTCALDRLCRYFAEYEPSSPIPLLLTRAKRLVPMTFLEILQELGPDVLSQAQRLQGDARL